MYDDSQMICITNRHICKGDFLDRIREVVLRKPRAVILREKDLTADEYADLALKVLEICSDAGVMCIYHTFIDTAIAHGVRQIHLPLPLLLAMTDEDKRHFDVIGVSCHSRTEAIEAQSQGATYIIAGHVFDTDCKKGLPGRGLSFLQEVVNAVGIPVYGIGGITESNLKQVLQTGAKGGCMMSGFMASDKSF